MAFRFRFVPRMRTRAEPLWAGLLLLITAILYLPLRHSGFVYDDQWYVVQNAGIRHLDLRSIFVRPQAAAAAGSGLAEDAWRPLVTLSFALDYKFWKLNPAGYHLENLLLGLLNGWMVWLLLRRVLLPPPVAAGAHLAALAVFLWHPVQVQSLAWVSQRGTLLGSAGMLMALLMLSGSAPWSWVRLSISWLAFGAALFCRETAAGVILALALIDGLRLRRQGAGALSRNPFQFWLRYAGLIVLTLIYIVLRTRLLPSWSEFSGPRHWGGDAALGMMALATYFGKLLWPTHLRIHYAYPEPVPGLIMGAGLVILVFAAVLWWAWFRRPQLGAALAWIFIFLIPVLQFIPIRAFAAERYLYFSLIGWAWIVGMAYARYPISRPAIWTLVALYAAASARLIPTWQSEETIWAHSVRQDPLDAFARACYAQSLGLQPAAEQEYFRVLTTGPSDGIRYAALNNLAYLYHTRGESWKANYWRARAEAAKPRESNQNL